MALSSRNIATVAAAAGFRGADLQTAVAVALAESGGNPSAHALTSREDSRGLWQINVRAHPEFTSANLYDPATNARAAKAVLAKQGWRAWSTFTTGRFLLFMPTAGAATRSLPGGIDTGDPLGDKASGVVDSAAGTVMETGQAIQSVGQLAAKAGTWINNPRNWIRVLYVIVGSALVVSALVVVALPVATNVVGGPAVKLAKKALK